MHSKNAINENKNKKPKKIKLRLKMLVGQIRFNATSCHYTKFWFDFRKTRRWKFLNVKVARFAVTTAASMQYNRFTTAEIGKGMRGTL